MPFVIKTQKGFIKRTSDFGPFYGRIVLTPDISEAKKFTRRSDAEGRASTTSYRTRQPDDEGKWYSQAGRDLKKFGETLIPEIIEV